jgi:hypothetical protein
MIVTNIKSIIDRQQDKGINKYSKTVDQADLSIVEWIEHAQEEIADTLIYLECIKQKLLEKEATNITCSYTYTKKKSDQPTVLSNLLIDILT